MQSIHSIEAYAYGTIKDLWRKKEKFKRNDIIKQYKNVTKMFNFDYITKEDIKKHNPNGSEIPDHPYRILVNGVSGSEKTKALLNLINHELDIDKIYLYAKDPDEAKYQLLINKGEIHI